MTRPLGSNIPTYLKIRVWIRDNFTCLLCGSQNELTIDHIIPVSKGGKTNYDNLQTLCNHCNVKKNDRQPIKTTFVDEIKRAQKDHFSVLETAVKLRISQSAIYSKIRKKKIPSKIIGGLIMVPKSEVERITNNNGI